MGSYIKVTRFNGEYLIDKCDEFLVRKFAFYIATTYNGKRYAKTNGDPEIKNGTLLHRIILNPPTGLVVDHINRNSLDNRRKNLRIVSQRENVLNQDACDRNQTILVFPYIYRRYCIDRYVSKRTGLPRVTRSVRFASYIYFNKRTYSCVRKELRSVVSWRDDKLKELGLPIPPEGYNGKNEGRD